MHPNAERIAKSVKKVTEKAGQLKSYQVWLLFFTYSLALGLLIQLIILPYIFPQWHAGDGLLSGVGDWEVFHQIALRKAEEIREQGWEAWALSPRGQPVSGIASIFYVLITPLPAAVLPLNAALHASAALLLVKMLEILSNHKTAALLGAIPFLVFPSSLTWVSQMHNDSYAILGSFAFLYGWLLTANKEFPTNIRLTFGAIFFAVGGLLLVKLVRPYMLEVYIVLALVLLCLVLAKIFIGARGKDRALKLSALALIFLAQTLAGTQVEIRHETWQGGGTPQLEVQISAAPARRMDRCLSRWTFSGILPESVECKLWALVAIRQDTIKTRAGSNIDADVDLNSATKLVAYAPRALQIALFAPFPADWLKAGSSVSSSFTRAVSGIEMSITYIFLAFLPVAVWKWRTNFMQYPVLIYAFLLLIAFAFALANVGTLYRVRYPSLMLLIGMGATSAASMRFKHTETS